MWSRLAVRAALLPLALVAACHPRVLPPTARPTPTPTPTPTERPAPEVPRARVVASVIQPTALLALTDRLVVPETTSDSFVLLPLRGDSPRTVVRGVGFYPRRLLADGDDAWIAPYSDAVLQVTAAGMHTPLVSSQPVYAIARDATHLYYLSANAPNLRRVPRLDAQGRAVAPDRARDLAEGLTHVAGAVDLAAIDGDVYLATADAVVLVRPGAAPRRLSALPSAPSVMTVDARDVFVGTDGGLVVRVPRDGGRAVELGRIEGRVAALHVDGCLVYAGGARGVVAFERARGARVPIAEGGGAGAVTTAAGNVYFTDYEAGCVRSLPVPACPSETSAGGARELVGGGAASAMAAPATDDDPLAGRSQGTVHTVVIRFGTSADRIGREAASRLVSSVVASGSSELWARATDAQLLALQEHGFDAAVRDGVDRLRCADLRREPARVRRAPPPPWHASRAPTVFLVQLGASSTAFDELASALSASGAVLVDSLGPATLLVVATPAAARRLPSRVAGATFVTAYGPHERLEPLARSPDAEDAPPCGPDPDAPLRALARWIVAAPGRPTELSITLFRPSRAVERSVLAEGGVVLSGAGGEQLAVRVPRRSLAALGDADDVRSIELRAEATIEPVGPQ